jgi:hypothetical protein
LTRKLQALVQEKRDTPLLVELLGTLGAETLVSRGLIASLKTKGPKTMRKSVQWQEK